MNRYLMMLSLWLAPVVAQACSCINAGDFCSILPLAIESDALVVEGFPVRTIGHGMEFEITQVVAGTENRKRITVWGDPGYLCRTYVTGFKRSDQLILILGSISQDRTESSTGKTERAGDYVLSVCGQYFAYLNGPNKTELDCYSPTDRKPSLTVVAPNPAQNYFSLLTGTTLAPEEIIQINVYQSNGQLLYQKGQVAILENNNGIEIATADWANNLYFVEIRTLHNKWLAKVVVLK